jgi:glycosyltransferase involved in cell wall biosynthesis
VDDLVTVAIPVRNGGGLFEETLAAVRAQRLERPVELVVADTASSDGSDELARRHGARVIAIEPDRFSHGGTRNLLVEQSRGGHIAFITQDAVPAHERWLAELLAGFEAADDVGLVFGRYVARPGASVMVRRELDEWFAGLAPDGEPRVERGEPRAGEEDLRRLFFTDANGCIARRAWERVPFRPVAYAEDQLLARDMLSAGYAKVYRPEAAVIHSHDYPPIELLRRSFDEWRGLREVHASGAPAGPVRVALTVQRRVRDDVALARHEGDGGGALARTAAGSLVHHLARAIGAALGARAERLPARARSALSLEGRA